MFYKGFNSFTNLFVVYCFNWHENVENEDCLVQSLVKNNWGSYLLLSNSTDEDLKEFLVEILEKSLDNNIHSKEDLFLRYYLHIISLILPF